MTRHSLGPADPADWRLGTNLRHIGTAGPGRRYMCVWLLRGQRQLLPPSLECGRPKRYTAWDALRRRWSSF
jgi:hypothetical protein